MAKAYQEELEIDVQALDTECLDQATRFMRWSERSTQAAFEVDRAKEMLDFTIAKLSTQVRDDPEAFDLPKVTEAGIQAVLATDEDCRKVLKSYHVARRDAAVLAGAVRAMEQRRSMLSELVKLHGQGYFAGPSVPRTMEDVQAARDRSVTEKVKNATRRQRKG